jgi:hypothetical protein
MKRTGGLKNQNGAFKSSNLYLPLFAFIYRIPVNIFELFSNFFTVRLAGNVAR